MNAYRDYIFDLYGTLVDIRTDESGRRLWELSALYYSEHGAPYSASELRADYLGFCSAEQSKKPDPYYEIELRNVFKRLYSGKGVEADERLIAETAVFFRLTSTKKLRLYPWVNPVFERIRSGGSGIYLLSNAQACFTLPELSALGMGGAFDGIALSSDAGVKKPGRGIMERLINGSGLDPKACLMVGNDQHTDMMIAREFDMDGLYIQTETSGKYDPSLHAKRELLDGDFKKLPALLGLEE